MRMGPMAISRGVCVGIICSAVVSAVTGWAPSHYLSGNSLAAHGTERPRPTVQDQATSLIDQTELAVTVYNSNIALVRDVRNLSLPTGSFRLKFTDIAATVNPATVHFRSLNEPEKLGVVEQNYEYDLLEPAKLLHKYVGKEVTLVRSYRSEERRVGKECRSRWTPDQ